MKRSLRRKYQLAGCVMVLGFLFFSMFLNSVFKQPFVVWKNEGKMAALAEDVVGHLEDDDENLQEYLETVASEHNVRISIVDENYQFLSSTVFGENRKGQIFSIVQRALEECQEELEKTGSCFSSRYFDETNNCLYLIQINKIDGYGYVTLRKSLVGLSEDMDYMNTFYALSGGVTLVLAVLLITAWSKKTVEPLEKMNQITRQIADLNFSESLQVTSEDEVGMLAESINVMSERLEKNLEELQEGIQFRKNLIRNMAHELKTPVTVVMGYAENLSFAASHSPEKLERYSRVISDECGRMNQMIQEMLELSAYENREDVLHVEKFSADRLLEGLRKCFETEFGAMGFLYREQNEIVSDVCGDYDMLLRAVYNFVKNAVQHSGTRGEILIHFYEHGAYQYFSVYNSGSFIPEKEMGKIWEAFYKVDKARSRERGSCGIGLSIVKEAALAHGGGVQAENVDDGVKFTIYIKK